MEQEKPIDPTALVQWLERQHHEDRQRFTNLTGIINAQQQELEGLTERFEVLDQRLTEIQENTTQYSDLEEGLKTLKAEIMGVVEIQKSQAQQADAHLMSRLDDQHPQLLNLARSLASFHDTVAALERQIELVPSQFEEQVSQMAGLTREIEDLERRFGTSQVKVAEINEQWENQAKLTESMAHQLQDMAEGLSATQSQLVKLSQIETMIQRARDEIEQSVREVDKTWQTRSREATALHDTEIRGLRTTLDSLERELEPIPQHAERLETLSFEDRRLRDMISEEAQKIPPLYEALDAEKERISYLEADRPRLAHRFDMLEPQIPPLSKAIAQNKDKTRFLEEWIQRNSEQIDEFKRLDLEMERWQSTLMEEIRQGEINRDRRLSEWETSLAEHAQIIEQWRETINRFEIAHHDNIRAVEAYQGLPEKLERDRVEIEEKQRLFDERIQREFEAWQEENEKRWRLFLKQYDFVWEQQVKRDVAQDERFVPIEAWREALVDRISAEFERMDENDRRILARMVDIARYVDRAVEHQIAQQKKLQTILAEELRPAEFDVLETPPRHELVTRATERSRKNNA